MPTLKEIRNTALYKALMKIPGVKLMEIDKELQAASATVPEFAPTETFLLDAFVWFHAPQGFTFWNELAIAQEECACA